MENEVFEKIFMDIEKVLNVKGYAVSYILPEKERKAKIKQILEEIESKNFRLGYEACDIDIADSEEAKP